MKARKLSVMALIALGGVMALAPMTRAQEKTEDAKPKAPQRERAPRPQDRIKRLSEELKLNDDQKTKVEAALKEQSEKMRELRQNTNLSAEERRTKNRELRQDLAGKMKTILDADQYEKWEKMRQAGVRARGPRAQRPGGVKPAGEKPPADK